jgi:hypothetical protein
MGVRCLTAVTRACKGFEELAPSAWTDYQTELSKALEILSRCSSALSHGPQTSRALYRAIEELERLQATRKAREDSARSTDAEAALTSPESNEGELGKPSGNNPGADTNPPEDPGGTVERVEAA